MASDFPFTAEYAKSGRSSCKSCRESIDKDELRLGVMVQSPHFDGRMPQWYHYECFWKKSRVSNANDVHGLDRLRWDDQEKIRNRVGGSSVSARNGKNLKLGDDGGSVSTASPAKIEAVSVEYAKSAASKCKKCGEKIAKGDIRLGKSGKFFHIQCAADAQSELLLLNTAADSMVGFTSLKPEDQAICRGKFKTLKRPAESDKNSKSGDVAPKKLKLDEKANEELNKKLKEQSDALWKIKDNIESRLTKQEMKILLEENEQQIPAQSVLSERLADCMLFGALLPCTECSGGQLVYSTSANAYRCVGSVSAFTKCQFLTKEPERKPFAIPSDLKDDNDFLKKYKFKPGMKRLFRPDSEKTASESGHYFKKKSMASRRAEYLSSMRNKSTKLVLKNGTAVDPDSNMTYKAHVYQDAKKNKYTVVLNMVDAKEGRNSFYKLQLLEHDGKKKYYVFRAWGRVGTDIGGTKIDKFDSDLQTAKDHFEQLYNEKTFNRWQDRENFVKHPGKFMPIEIDYGDNGPTISKVAPRSKTKLPPQIQDFIEVIFDVEKMKETMKEFDLDLRKMPLGKLSKKQIQSAYSVLSDLQTVLQDENSGRKSTQILDCTNRFYTLVPHDFGMDSPPLIDSLETLKTKSEMLDSLLEIEAAYNILKSDSADSMVDERDPIDVHYEKLRADLGVLDKSTSDFKLIVDYVKKTHAATHDQYALEVEEAFTLNRHGELERFNKYSTLHNRMLLWHGSRTSNYAGIVSQGLRIAPPEAPVTGYMFGKGIYFADMVSKSANYCFTNRKDNTGYLLLCEVALGNVHELTKDNSNLPKDLPKDKHSVKGCGKTAPNPATFVTLPNGVVVPVGNGQASGFKTSSLLYNEYIVYDVAQVNLKYIVKAKFKYKRC